MSETRSAISMRLARVSVAVFLAVGSLEAWGDPVSVTNAFDEQHLAERGGAFEFTIEDGPRRFPGEPIDYSELLRHDLIGPLFGNALFNCIEGLRYCRTEIFRLSGDTLPLKIFQEREALVEGDFEVLRSVLERTLGAAGFDVPAERDEDNARIILHIGSIRYLALKASNADDLYGVAFFDRASASDETCYVSTQDRWEHQKFNIYLQPHELESCLPRSLMVVLGLNETSSGYPTVTDRSGQYTAITYLDRVFLHMLYSKDFPLDSGIVPIRAFWNDNISRISAELNPSDDSE